MDFKQQEHIYGSNDEQQQESQQKPVQPSDVESQGAAAAGISDEQGAQKKQVGCCGFLTVEYYQPFFNVTSVEVKKRLINVFIPTKPEFQNGPKKNPDLWGPFWTLTTVIFLLCVCGNLSSYIADQEKYIVSFDYAPLAAGLIYGIGIGFPVALSVLIKCCGGETSPIEAVCLYGYSMACFAVVAALSAIPFTWLQWILTIYGFLNSTIFIIVNIFGDIRNLPLQKKYIILGTIGVFQIIFMLSFKLFFFSVFKD